MGIRCLSLILVCWGLLSCSSGYDESQGYARAIEYFNDGDYRSAEIELKQVLSQDSNNNDARLLLAKTFYEMNEFSNSETEAQRFLDGGEVQSEPYEILLKSYLKQGSPEKVLDLNISSFPDSERLNLELLRANAFLLEGELERAQSILEKYRSNGGNTPIFLLVKAKLLAALGRYEEARAAISEHMAAEDRHYEALILLADLEAVEGSNVTAEELYSKAIGFNPYLFEAYMKRAVVRIQKEDFVAAEKDLRVVYKRFPDSVHANYMIGIVSYLKDDFENAEKAFEFVSPAHQRFPDALYYLGQISYRNNEYVKAEDYLRRYLSVAPESVPALKLISIINFESGNYDAVEEDLSPLATLSDLEVSNIRAGALLESGNVERSVELYQEISQLNPNSESARVNLGIGYLRARDYDNSIETLEAVFQNEGTPQVGKLLVLNYIGKGDLDTAEAFAKRFSLENPDIPDGFNMRGMVDLVRGNLNQARDNFIQARERGAKDLFASNNLAKIYLSEGQGEKALEVYRSLLSDDSPESYLNYAKAKLILGDEPGFKKAVSQSIELDPEYASPRFVLAEYYYSKGEMEKIPSAFVGSESIAENPSYMRIMYLYEFERKEYLQASYYLERMEDSDFAKKEVVYYNYSKLHAAQGNSEQSLDYLKKSVQANPDYFPSLLAMARIYVSGRDWIKSKVLVDRLEQDHKENPDALAVVAAYYDGQGRFEDALGYSLAAFEKDKSRERLLTLASRYWKAGKTDDATGVVEAWLVENPEDNFSREALSDFYLSVGNYALAQENLESIIKYDGKNVAALNNLAWILKDDQPAAAVRYAEQANEILPDTPEVLDTLAMTYLSAGSLDKAWGSIRRAASMRPDNKSILYHSALIAVKSGNQDYSLVTLREIVEEEKDFPERESAEKLLNELSVYQ